jgi:SP family arabinose:H+ symporter-like MFS transporter
MAKNSVLTWSFIIALGGFLFGFDTAVISGAERAVQLYWDLSAIQHGFTMAVALIGTIVGAAVGAIPSDKLGRKKTLFLVSALYFFSALGTALAENWTFFIIFRFLGGVGVGASSVVAPIYISEISPAKSRGRLVGLFQFNVVLGILIAYLSNYVIGQTSENSWRWMLGVQAFPALLFYALIHLLPESPRWLLLQRNNKAAAESILRKINTENYQQELTSILSTDPRFDKNQASRNEKLFSKKYSLPIVLAILIAVFNQFAGINAIIYYAPRVFELAGLGVQSSLLSTVGIGAVNFIFTLIAINVIDRLGRRTLMLIGSIGLIASLSMVSYSFFMQDAGAANVLSSGLAITVYLMVYIAFFAFSQGAVIWVFISEIFPNEVRAKGQTLGSLTHWVMAAVITFSFPMLTAHLGGGSTFLIFVGCMLLQLLFVWRLMPETKGRSLEQIEGTFVVAN